jgi:HSP20 family protein
MERQLNWKPIEAMIRDVMGDYSPLFDMRHAMCRDDLDFIPKLDIKNTAGEFEVSLDLPGIAKEAIEIAVDDGVLTVRGTRDADKREEQDGYTYVERRMGRFERSVRLPENVSEADITAAYKDGVLTLRAAKRPVARPESKKIAIT